MELPDSVKPFSGEGGEVEMNDRNKVVPVEDEQTYQNVNKTDHTQNTIVGREIDF